MSPMLIVLFWLIAFVKVLRSTARLRLIVVTIWSVSLSSWSFRNWGFSYDLRTYCLALILSYYWSILPNPLSKTGGILSLSLSLLNWTIVLGLGWATGSRDMYLFFKRCYWINNCLFVFRLTRPLFAPNWSSFLIYNPVWALKCCWNYASWLSSNSPICYSF